MDGSLTARLAADPDGSFEELVREHQDRLYSLALRYTGNASDAEELTQDAFVRAYRALAGYDEARIGALELRPWLTTILLNVCRNHVVRPARRVAQSAVPLEPVAETLATGARASPVVHVERREAAERWAGLVATLPPIYRAAVLLRHLDGMSYEEMAQTLGRPEGTVKAQVHRGVALLRAAFEADERRHSSATARTPDPVPRARMRALEAVR
jgi:RNA polymerase sigma-70 factor (ECF subfamily)